MTDLKMKAPKNVDGANIEGHQYHVKNGIIKVVSPTHVERLKRHGFVEYEDPADVAEKIDEIDDKGELVRMIEEHGGEADDSMSLKKLRRLAKEAVTTPEEE